MEERTIWSLAFRDIVGVVPLRILRDVIPLMTLQDIKKTSICALQIDRLFQDDIIRPAKITWVPLRSNAAAMDVFPGGQLILVMHDDGSLHLYPVRDLEASLASIKRPETNAPRVWDVRRMCLLVSSWHGKHLAVAYESFCDVKCVTVNRKRDCLSNLRQDCGEFRRTPCLLR